MNSFIHADRIPGGAEQFGWPHESTSIHTGTMALQQSLLEAASWATAGNEALFDGPPPVSNAQLARLAGHEDFNVLYGPSHAESLQWPPEKPRRHRSRSSEAGRAKN